jgi:transposase InsO family protein
MFGLSKSSYYRWLQKPIGKRESHRCKVDQLVIKVFNEHKGRYGSCRISQEIRVVHNLSVKRQYIAKRMQALGLVAKARRKFNATTDSKHNLPIAKNLLKQNFVANAPNEKWVTDITYIRTQQGWLYLCVIIDLFSRSVIGWSMSKRINKQLVCNALSMALWRRQFPTNVIVHSDRGSQYCSKQYQKLLKQNQLICSMSGKGCCYDNAACESFFHSLKVELVHDENYQSRQEAKLSIFEYINVYYNRKRRHSAIKYMTPEQFENTMQSLSNIA